MELNMINYTDNDLNNKLLKAKIAGRLHEERKIKSNLSLDALSEKIMYSKPTVQAWEKGWEDGTGENTIPSMEQLIRLSTFYHCTPEYLLCEYDLKSKQTTDVAIETGLLPESYAYLHNKFSLLLENDCNEHGYFHIMLQFINHFISNFDTISDALYYRVIAENLNRGFSKCKYKDLLLEGYKSISLTKRESFSIRTKDHGVNAETQFFIQPLTNFFIAKGLDANSIDEALDEFRHYYKVLVLNEVKQADFSINESFFEILNSFLASYPDNANDYLHFSNALRETHNISCPTTD